jgi:hypothetical protein
MQTIPLEFDLQKIEDIEQLVEVLGYIRGESFNVEINESGVLPEAVVPYVEQLQEQNALESNGKINEDTILIINYLLMGKKYEDPSYVAVLHQWLVALGYGISEEEISGSFYGETTNSAVKNAQMNYGLSNTGQVDAQTEQMLAAAYNDLNNGANNGEDDGGDSSGEDSVYQEVSGRVLNSTWQGVAGVSIKVFEKLLRNNDVLLSETTTGEDGHYQIAYEVPVDTKTNQAKENFHLLVKRYDQEEQELESLTFFNAAAVVWANFTEGTHPYLGISDFEDKVEKLNCVLDGLPISEIQESEANQDVTYLYKTTGIQGHYIMQLVLAHNVAAYLESYSAITADVIYSFITQGLPASLPSYLLPDELSEWESWMTGLVAQTAMGLLLTDVEMQHQALSIAVESNKLLIASINNLSQVKIELQTARNNMVLEQPLIANKMALGEVLEAVTITGEEQHAIVEAFANRPEFSPRFIASLEKKELITKETAQELTKEYQIAGLANYSKPLIQQLKAVFTTNEALEGTSSEESAAPILKVSDFAKWSEQDWESFLGEEDVLMQQMKMTAESFAPDVATIAAAKRTQNHQFNKLDALEALVDDNPSLNLRENHLDSFIKANSLVLDEQTLDELKTLQRVQRISPTANAAAVLLDNGIHSAHQAQQLGLQGLAPLFGSESSSGGTAAQIANAANSMVALVTGLHTTYGNVFNTVSPHALINLTADNAVINDSIEGIPDLENLFGANDYCTCEHCRSVYSPAAYLTDVLHWLGQRSAVSPLANAKAALLARRPDLECIDLNCKNTNTPLPYIDLVCEVLEQAISEKLAYVTRNTTWTAAELRAMPEYVQEGVYDKLANITKPYASYNAFNLWQSEAHLYLETLGVSYHQLIDILQKNPTEDFNKACAYFKIPTKEGIAITVPLTDVNQLSWSPNTQVGRNVKTFLEEHQLSYQQLIELLQGRFINPVGSIIINRPVNSCGLSGQDIMGLGPNEMDRIWRFLRLWKYTNWALWELDLVLVDAKIGMNDLNVANLITIYQFHQLQQQLDWSVEKCLSLFGTVNIHERLSVSNKPIASLYEQVYLNPLLDTALKSNFELSVVTTNTATINTTNSEWMAYIAMAVGTDHDTVVNIIEQHAGAGFTHLFVLSAVYKQVNLAQYLGLTVAELMETVALTQTNPFLNVSYSSDFLKQFKDMQESGMSVSAINYLIKGEALQLYINNSQIYKWQTTLNASLRTAYDALFVSNDTYRVVLDRQLSKIAYFEDVAVRTQMIELVLHQEWTGSANDRDGFVDAAFGAWAPESYVNSLKQQLAAVITNTNNPTNPNPNPNPTSPLTNIQNAQKGRVKMVYTILHWQINRVLIVEFIAQTFSVSDEVSAYFLDLEHPSAMSSGSLIERLFAYSLSTVSFVPPNVFEAYYFFHKIAFIVNEWDLSIQELTGFLEYKSAMNTLSFDLLPIDNNMGNLSYATWRNTWKFVQFSRQFGASDSSRLFDILPLTTSSANADFETLQELLLDWTGMDLSAIKAAHTHLGFGANGASYQTIESYNQLQNVAALLSMVPANYNHILEWRVLDTATFKTTHQQIKNALNAKLEPTAWLKAQEHIQGFIRIEKRDALIAYTMKYDALGIPVKRSVEDLFNYYLIDPKMSACQLTSRIKQAISSTQLFVQRCRLSLESISVLVNNENKQKWSQWEWIQNYRVWEANRKVFLYPENWIEPALRDDKSEFFEAFEDELLQAEITHDNVEKAFTNYLLKVHEVANMDMMGMCQSIEEEERVLHVLAKTKEHPATYYYRKQKDKIWTAWQKVDVDIKGDHAIPYVYNNRVHIFWLEILEKPMKQEMLPKAKEDTSTASGANENYTPEAAQYKEIQLGWTVLKEEGWIPKKISKRKLIHPWPRPHYSMHLRPRGKDGDLYLDIYVSTSMEFNDTHYYNQFNDKYELLTETSFNETIKPFHSASFVFDGFVRQVKLYGIDGEYWFVNLVNSPDVIDVEVLEPAGAVYFDEIDWESNKYITNYGTYSWPTDSQNNQDSLNQKIGETVWPNASNKPVVRRAETKNGQSKISVWNPGSRHWTSMTLQELNEFLAGEARSRPTITIQKFSTTTTNGVVSTNTSNKKEAKLKIDSNSYEYIYNTFGEEGRLLERMADHEKATDLEQPASLHFEYNYLTGNRLHNSNDGRFVLFNPTATRGEILRGIADEEILLEKAISKFKVFYPMEETQHGRARILQALYQDNLRTFYFNYEEPKADGTDGLEEYSCYPMYHPYTRAFIRELNSGGVDSLLARETQINQSNDFDFETIYDPITDSVSNIVNNEDIVDFSLKGTYATYNWETFFHIPLLIATELSKNQRFEEAMRWFHFMFNPTDTEAADPASPSSHFWVTKPFYEHNQEDYQAAQIQNLLNNTGNSEVMEAINIWKKNPFKPHLIARYRLVAFQKAVVMKYIDNLVAWGDQLFRRDTMESINEASLMYILAYEILGKRPEEVTPLQTAEQNYQELSIAGLDSFSNTDLEIRLEGLVRWNANNNQVSVSPSLFLDDNLNNPKMPVLRTKYFCIPKNDKLLGYWDLVEDRLFKIRHCMNIDGIVRQLPLFAPPIDPALLVNAVANGVDLSSVLNNLASPRSNYKYRTLSRLAIQFCSEVKSLGQSLLSALQAKDSEGMALLQSANGLKLLDAMLSLKELQIEESKENIQSLELSKLSAIYRKDFYTNRESLIQEEKLSLELGRSSIRYNIAGTVLANIASGVAFIPDFEIGVSGALGSPVAITTMGGTQISRAISSSASAISGLAGIVQKEAGLASQKGGYKRRQEEWDLQIELATKESEQIDKQLAAAKIRLAIAEKDLDNHKLQIKNAKSEEEYLKRKYTNKELYSWMTSQLSTVYFQAYQLAFDMAKRAEKSMRYELALPNAISPFIQFGYWDSLKKGLLSGDKMMLAINKMEVAYVEQNKRNYELTKQISLRQLTPDALLALKLTGTCEIDIPEWWFDMDYPGHFMRRIKAVSISIPCIVGPNTNVGCTLSMTRNTVRSNAIISDTYEHEDNYEVNYGMSESIAISNAQNDSGVFELNFNDERYLPFEGTGVISRWTLTLSDIAQFDYQSITDVVLYLRYTAKEGGATLKSAALDYTKAILDSINTSNQPTILMSLKQEFGTAWHRFINPLVATDPNKLDFELKEKHYPFFTKFSSGRKIVACSLYVLTKDGTAQTYKIDITTPIGATTIPSGNTDVKQTVDVSSFSASDGIGNWLMELNAAPAAVPASTLAADNIEDIILTIEYQVVL